MLIWTENMTYTEKPDVIQRGNLYRHYRAYHPATINVLAAQIQFMFWLFSDIIRIIFWLSSAHLNSSYIHT
jgi:hypothetical protein